MSTNGLAERVEFESAGGIAKFDGVFFGLVSVEGLGDVSADIQTQKSPYQDGVTYLDSILEPRYVSVEFIVRGKDYADVRTKRVLLTKAVNPKVGLGTLRYISGDTVREIPAVAETIPFFPDGDNRGERWQRGTISFLCPDPYWLSEQIKEEPTFTPLFEFPFEGEFEFGMQLDERIINIEGDVSTPIQVDFYGPALNPTITNETTGEFIRINRQLNEGEYLRIDTSPNNKSVEFVNSAGVATNVFNWIDLASTFWELQVGENKVTYSADSDIQGAVVDIRYTTRFAGV